MDLLLNIDNFMIHMVGFTVKSLSKGMIGRVQHEFYFMELLFIIIQQP